MKSAWKIAAAAVLALPLMAVSANARDHHKTNKNKQNNYYKASITGNVLVQNGDDYKKEKIKTDDVISALLAKTGLTWSVKKCDLIMQIGPNEDALDKVQWWLFTKDGKTTKKIYVTGLVNVEGGDYVVYKRKYSAKGDNEKVRSEFTEAYFEVDTPQMNMEVYPVGTADVTIKGVKTMPYLNNVKLRTKGSGSTGADAPLTIELKVKGRISNSTFEGATDVTPRP